MTYRLAYGNWIDHSKYELSCLSTNPDRPENEIGSHESELVIGGKVFSVDCYKGDGFDIAGVDRDAVQVAAKVHRLVILRERKGKGKDRKRKEEVEIETQRGGLESQHRERSVIYIYRFSGDKTKERL